MTIQELEMLVAKDTLELAIRAAKTRNPEDYLACYAGRYQALLRYAAMLLGTVAGLEALVASQNATLDVYDAMARPAEDNIADDPWIVDLSKALTSGVYEFTLTEDIIARERAGRDQ
jgi:hypothetical protein